LIYLDTHVVVWLYAGQVDKLSSRVKTIVNDNDLLISPIVRLELQYLYEIERITVTEDKIISDLQYKIGLEVCGIEYNNIVSNALAIHWTRDPFDRMIVANASGHTLLTKDKTILENYSKAVW